MKSIVAERTRSEGEWHSSDHFAQMEIRHGCSNSITSVQKDNLVIEVYETSDTI